MVLSSNIGCYYLMQLMFFSVYTSKMLSIQFHASWFNNKGLLGTGKNRKVAMKKLAFIFEEIKTTVLFLLVSTFTVTFASCSKDDNEDGLPEHAGKLIIGEWARIRSEGYDEQGELVYTSPVSDGDEATWIFGENNYFYYCLYPSEGSYKLSDNQLILEGTWAEGIYNIERLTKDELVVSHEYPDNEYSYEIDYFERLSFYDDSDSEISADAMKFVGTWYDGGKHFWYFAKNGDLYVGKDENINNKNYITKKLWSYDPDTKTLATTAHWNDIWPTPNYTWGNFDYVWLVLVYEDNFWTGQDFYAGKGTTTFTRVEK